MSRHRSEQTGVVGERSPQSGSDDRCGNRPPPGAGQGSGPEQLSQAVGGEEVGGDDADAPGAYRAERSGCEQPPGGDPDVVGGDEDGNGRQGIIAFGGGDGRPEGLSSRPAIRDPYDFSAQNNLRSSVIKPNICNECTQRPMQPKRPLKTRVLVAVMGQVGPASSLPAALDLSLLPAQSGPDEPDRHP